MNHFELEHLKTVAWRNSDLYRRNKALFERKMSGCGWTNEEIKRMEDTIERMCWGNGTNPTELAGT